MGERVKISCRLPAGLVKFLDEQVEEKTKRGVRSDRSMEVAIAIQQRQLSKLPEDQRKALLEKLRR